jgi:LysM repeat protein
MGIIFDFIYGMKGIKSFCLLVMLISSSTLIFAQNTEIKKSTKTQTIEGVKYYLHSVEKGQTIYSICSVYGLTKNDLILENPELISGIKEGQELKIPSRDKSNLQTTDPEREQKINSVGSYIEHKVEPKQTLYAISKLYNISMDEVVRFNPELEAGLKTGQIIKIPRKITVPTYQKPEKKEHAVINDDNLQNKSLEPNSISTYTNSDTTKADKSRIIKVAVLLPFYLNMQNYESDSLGSVNHDIYFKSLLGIDFYQGLMMAIDSCVVMGYNIEVYAYDVSGDSLDFVQVLAKPELTTMDLLIGPLYNDRLQQATLFSKKNKIPLISPFSQINKVLLGNIYASKIVASQHTQMEAICNYVKQSKPNERIYLVTDENSKEASLINLVKKNFIGFKDSLRIISIKKGFNEIEKLLNDGKQKVFITPINDQPKITELVTKLYLSKDSNITLIGTDSWFNFSNVETQRLAKTNTILPNYYFVDYNSESFVQLAKEYQSIFGVEPNRYAIQGFDIGMYYLPLALKGKEALLNLNKYTSIGIQNEFNFYKTADESGFENRHVFLLSLKNIAPQKVNE